VVASSPTEAMPKKWQQHHNQWLNAMIRAAIGEENHPKLLDLHAKVQVLCPGPELDVNIAPAKEYVTRFYWWVSSVGWYCSCVDGAGCSTPPQKVLAMAGIIG